MLKNYAGAVGIGLGVILLFVFALTPMLDPLVGGIVGHTVSTSEWMHNFTEYCVAASIICTLSILAWIYLSSSRYPIDPSGLHTQMPYWILHALPPLAAALAGYFIQPTITEGGMQALLVILVPIVLQYWVSSALFSPNPRSVLMGSLIRKK